MRYVLEGTWTGYVSRQCRVVHREVMTERRKRDFKLHTIEYTDGTKLLINVREAQPRERVVPVDAYGSLIRQAEKTGQGFVKVIDLD